MGKTAAVHSGPNSGHRLQSATKLSAPKTPTEAQSAEGKNHWWSAAGFVCDLKALLLHGSNFNNSDCLPASVQAGESERERSPPACLLSFATLISLLSTAPPNTPRESDERAHRSRGYTGKVGNRGDSCVARHTIRCAFLSALALYIAVAEFLPLSSERTARRVRAENCNRQVNEIGLFSEGCRSFSEFCTP